VWGTGPVRAFFFGGSNTRTQDLDALIAEQEVKMNGLSEDDTTRRSRVICTLGQALAERCIRKNSLNDRERALALVKTGLHLQLPKVDKQAGHIVDLGHICYILSHAGKDVSAEDIESEVDLFRLAFTVVQDFPKSHRLRCQCLQKLAESLLVKYSRSFEPNDIEEAISVTGMLKSDNGLAANYMDHANALQARFLYGGGSLDDIDAAVEANQKALELSSPRDGLYQSLLIQLGASLKLRFLRTESLEDIEMAIKIVRKAIAGSVTPPTLNELSEDPKTSLFRRIELTDLLHQRFVKNGAEIDLKEATEIGTDAVNDADQIGIGRLRELTKSKLGEFYLLEFELRSSEASQRKAIDLFTQVSVDVEAPPIWRILAAKNAATQIFHANPRDAFELLHSSLKQLLPVITSRQINRRDIQTNMRHLNGVTSLMVSMGLSSGVEPHEALQLLEFGKGVLASTRIEIRSDLSE
jgi:tetratricopeptide (TPR) repeat protein